MSKPIDPNRALGISILFVLFVGPTLGLVLRIPLAYTLSFMAACIAVGYGVAKYRYERYQRDRFERASQAYMNMRVDEIEHRDDRDAPKHS